jgi:hypothetical protein
MVIMTVSPLARIQSLTLQQQPTVMTPLHIHRLRLEGNSSAMAQLVYHMNLAQHYLLQPCHLQATELHIPPPLSNGAGFKAVLSSQIFTLVVPSS